MHNARDYSDRQHSLERQSVAKTSASLISAICVLVMLPVLSGCSFGGAEPNDPVARSTPSAAEMTQSSSAPPTPGTEIADGFGTSEDFRDEYDDAAADFKGALPAGVELPATPPGEWDPSGIYEEGAGYMAAAFAWQCAWAREYVSAQRSGDAPRADEALVSLESWVTFPDVVAHTDEAGRAAWVDSIITPAKEGHDSALSELAETC